MKFLNWLILLLVVTFPRPANAGQSATHNPVQGQERKTAIAIPRRTDYSKEPYLIEKYTTAIRFGLDGSRTKTAYARVEIQSDLAAQKFSHLVFNYDASAGSLSFDFVRVLKKDGSRATASLDSAADAPQEITRNSPAYESYRQKTIAVSPLRAGDVLEYQVVSRMHSQPDAQFWLQHSFLTDAVVLDESLEIDLPKSVHVALKSPEFPYTTSASSSGDRMLYRWKHANLTVPEEDSAAITSAQTTNKRADVNLTSFNSWTEVATWYAKNANPDQAPSSELRNKAAELTQGRNTDLDKMHSIYDYVSRIPEIDLPSSPGTSPLHSAAQVLSQKKATGADKQVLLAALLSASGISAENALVSGTGFDPALPSPAQFARMITAVRHDKEIIWLDPSSSVAPFEFLPASIRKKSALLIPSGKMLETPADPPSPSIQHVAIDGQVTSLGKLVASIRYQLRGDNEYVLRLAFHRTPESQWKELAQTMLALDGLHGDIISVKPSDPSNTQTPFALEIKYVQPGFIDWTAERMKVPIPLLAIGMPDAPKKRESAIEVGSPLDVTAELNLTFPQSYSVRAPVAIAVSREYADFKSQYGFAAGRLTAERSLDFKLRSVSPSQSNDYAEFSHSVAADQAQALVVENRTASSLTVPLDATAADLFEAGSVALSSSNIRSAIPVFEKLVAIDPKYPHAWSQLGLARMRARDLNAAIDAFQKQLELDPADPQIHNYLGVAYEASHKDAESMSAFRQQIALDPLDKIAHEALGNLYLSQHDYAQALPELDKAAVLSPDKASLQLSLGDTYLNLGQNEEALSALNRAVALWPTPAVWNAVARNLAEHKMELDKARKYAEAAAGSVNLPTQLDLAHLPPELFAQEMKLAGYWDTLGWVSFQKGDLASAERYFHSAWSLSPSGEIAFHLARVYEKRSEKENAVRTYASALVSPNPDPEAQARLTLLLGGNSHIPELLVRTKADVIQNPVFHVENTSKASGTADFLMILESSPGSGDGARATAVHFTEGKEELRPMGNGLRAISFGSLFPDRSRQKLVRSGRLECSPSSPQCTFTLLPLAPADSQKAE